MSAPLFWCADKMSSGEFDLIGRYFSIQKRTILVILVMGSIDAITHIPEGYQLAITSDTIGREHAFFYLHFSKRFSV